MTFKVVWCGLGKSESEFASVSSLNQVLQLWSKQSIAMPRTEHIKSNQVVRSLAVLMPLATSHSLDSTRLKSTQLHSTTLIKPLLFFFLIWFFGCSQCSSWPGFKTLLPIAGD